MLGEPASHVRPVAQGYLLVVNENVRVVIQRLRNPSGGVNKRNRTREVRELVSFLDPVLVARPTRKALQPFADFFVVELSDRHQVPGLMSLYLLRDGSRVERVTDHPALENRCAIRQAAGV